MVSASRDCLLIRGGEILRNGRLEQADVTIAGDTIVAVSTGGSSDAVDDGTQVLQADGHVIIPGFCNSHTHAHNVLFRGMLEGGSLEVLINGLMSVTTNRTPEETYAAALLNALETAKAGTTSVCEQFVTAPAPTLDHIGAVVKAYSDVGLRASIAPSASDLPFYPTVPGLISSLPDDLRQEIETRKPAGTFPFDVLVDAIDRWHGSSNGRISIAVAPSIPLHCSAAMLKESVELAKSKGLVLHTHLAESLLESVASLTRFGRSATAYLDDIGFLTDRTVVAHAVWISDSDLDVLSASNTIVAHNPASNLRLGAGIAPVSRMLARGIRVTLGTDGMGSSDNQNIFEAMRFATLVSHVKTADQSKWLTPTKALDMAHSWTSRVLGVDAQIGRIDVGFKADLVLVSKQSSYLHPENHFVNQLVLAESGSAVRTVIVDGEIIVREGKSVRVDETRVLEAVDAAAAAIRQRNVRHWQVSERLRPYIENACRSLESHMLE